MRVVIDASVGIKWIVRNPAVEPNADVALAILRGIRARTIEAVVPAHFTAEVLAVMARERPNFIPITFGILRTANLRIVATDASYRQAAELAIQLKHHLFDTLYHALALETGSTLVTADSMYFNKAKRLGSIERLAAFNV